MNILLPGSKQLVEDSRAAARQITASSANIAETTAALTHNVSAQAGRIAESSKQIAESVKKIEERLKLNTSSPTVKFIKKWGGPIFGIVLGAVAMLYKSNTEISIDYPILPITFPKLWDWSITNFDKIFWKHGLFLLGGVSFTVGLCKGIYRFFSTSDDPSEAEDSPSGRSTIPNHLQAAELLMELHQPPDRQFLLNQLLSKWERIQSLIQKNLKNLEKLKSANQVLIGMLTEPRFSQIKTNSEKLDNDLTMQITNTKLLSTGVANGFASISLQKDSLLTNGTEKDFLTLQPHPDYVEELTRQVPAQRIQQSLFACDLDNLKSQISSSTTPLNWTVDLSLHFSHQKPDRTENLESAIKFLEQHISNLAEAVTQIEKINKKNSSHCIIQ
jgi:hypothetical protein